MSLFISKYVFCRKKKKFSHFLSHSSNPALELLIENPFCTKWSVRTNIDANNGPKLLLSLLFCAKNHNRSNNDRGNGPKNLHNKKNYYVKKYDHLKWIKSQSLKAKEYKMHFLPFDTIFAVWQTRNWFPFCKLILFFLNTRHFDDYIIMFLSPDVEKYRVKI